MYDVPEDQLVLFDDGGWCLALMLAPVFWTEEEYDAFDAELAAMDFDYNTRWDAGSTELRARISKTWSKIFDAEAAWGDGSAPPCAAVWELRLEWVKSAERFKTRKSTNKRR